MSAHIPTVLLKTFFDKDNRTIEDLSMVYKDCSLLYDSIQSLLNPLLKKQDVCGKKILLKPNWVSQNRKELDELCMRTNNSIIIELVRYLLTMEPSKITIGDAPIQGCNWEKMLSRQFYDSIALLSKEYHVPIAIKDFRKVRFAPKENTLQENVSNESDYVIFDVGEKSFLEEITDKKKRFRVTDYNPDNLALSHHKGVHKYCIAKDVFESDIIITMPKIKTHQKAGLTNSLKILVGVNGDKDYLPHHRIGAVEQGGDCYKGWHPFRRLSELLLDEANRHRGEPKYKKLKKISTYLWLLSFPNNEQSLSAGWYGNDTVWRMVIDINTVARYGTIQGILSDKPQRTLFSLCDGIVAGQGNGPLDPEPLALGIMSFTNDPYLMDVIAGYLMGINVDRVPLLSYAKKINKDNEMEIRINGERADVQKCKELAVSAIMPPGWLNYNNNIK